MNKTLVFATNNQHKFKEASKILTPGIKLLSLKDIDCDEDIPETGNTIRANAFQKARYIHEKYGMNCFADDTGLEVFAIGNRPGIYSARFAGANADASDNIQKLLIEMKGITERRARFVTVIALIIDGKENYFEGEISGTILTAQKGSGGFGYDPVFVPAGYEKTFSEMTGEEKNKISHRAIALKKLNDFFQTL